MVELFLTGNRSCEKGHRGEHGIKEGNGPWVRVVKAAKLAAGAGAKDIQAISTEMIGLERKMNVPDTSVWYLADLGI